MIQFKKLFFVVSLIFPVAYSPAFADYYHSDSGVGPKTPPGSDSLSVLTFSALRSASHTYCEEGSCGFTGFMYHKKERPNAQAPISDIIKTCVVQGSQPDFHECVVASVYNRVRTGEDFEIGSADFAISKNLMAVAWVEVSGISPTQVTYKYSLSYDAGQTWSAVQEIASYQVDEYAGAAVVQDIDVAFNDFGQLGIALFLDQERGSHISVLGNPSDAYISLISFSLDGQMAGEVPVVIEEGDAPEYESLGSLNIMDLAGGMRDTFHLVYAKSHEYTVYTEQSRSSYLRTIPAPYGIGSTFPELSPHEGTYGLALVVERGSMMLGQEGNFFIPDDGMHVYGMTSQIYPRRHIASSVVSPVSVNDTFMPAPSANLMFYTNGGDRDPEELLQVSETVYWPEYIPDLWTLRCRHELGLDPSGSGQVWERFCYRYEPVGLIDSIMPNVGSHGVVVGSRYYDSSILTTETNDEVLPWYAYDQKVVVADCDLEGECAQPPHLSFSVLSATEENVEDRAEDNRQNILRHRIARSQRARTRTFPKQRREEVSEVMNSFRLTTPSLLAQPLRDIAQR